MFFKRLVAAAALIGAAAAGPAMAQSGADLFGQNCAACHQAQGEGIPGAFPALAGNAFAQGSAETVVQTVLDGRGGMPTFRSELNDEQIAIRDMARDLSRYAAVVNYDNFSILPGLVPAWSEMVERLTRRYYSRVTRYGTGGFLKARLEGRAAA